jgi:molybdopterin converting factor small subunit
MRAAPVRRRAERNWRPAPGPGNSRSASRGVQNGGVVTVRYWAGARSAAGRAEEALHAATVGDLLTQVASRHDIERVIAVCSLLVDGVNVRRDDTDRQLPAGAVVDVLPPFAGG